jgi:hypothetical protein
MIELYHRGGPKPCLRPAVKVRRLPDRYELAAENVVLLNGATPKRGDPMICGSCGEPLHPQWLYRRPEG